MVSRGCSNQTQLFSFGDDEFLRRGTALAVNPHDWKKMNRYLVFTYYVGRSFGGMKDFLDSFETMAHALENLLPEPTRYFQIVDRDSSEIVKEGLTIFKDCDPEAFSKG